MKVLFVCIGNICRSPIAEGVLKHLSDQRALDWKVDSAAVRNYHIGKPPHVSSQKVCKQHGIDIDHQKAMLFVPEHINQYDKIYAMATDVMDEIKTIAGTQFDENKIHLFLDYQYPGEEQSVVDPYYGEEAGYLPVYQQINEVCNIIIEKYSKKISNEETQIGFWNKRF